MPTEVLNEIENINIPENTYKVNATKYTAMRMVLLKALLSEPTRWYQL